MFTGWEWYPARNSAPDGSHAEDSLAIFGISREDALVLAQRFGQAAFVYWDGDAVELVWSRDTPDAEG